jgi:hypothetical protein
MTRTMQGALASLRQACSWPRRRRRISSPHRSLGLARSPHRRVHVILAKCYARGVSPGDGGVSALGPSEVAGEGASNKSSRSASMR